MHRLCWYGVDYRQIDLQVLLLMTHEWSVLGVQHKEGRICEPWCYAYAQAYDDRW